ncbi:DUF6228 family protein [Rhodanobacter ginsengisoli]|uniref:DUF6228 family protein n=1 Tax=Rhodanobacter ginsengisoli TaxID=418646 RepID=A0ABW0QW54_9GAMM
MIKSTASDRELAFVGAREHHFTVEFRSLEVRAVREVYSFPDAPGPETFFSRIAAHDRPWAGSDDWSSLEGEFSISATCDRSGHVVFSVSICGVPGAADEWRVTGSITSELGQLPALAKEAIRFFGVGAGI